MTAVELLGTARALLVRDGWCQAPGRDSHGRRCLTIALDDAIRQATWLGLSSSGAGSEALDRLRQVCPEIDRDGIVRWNDHPDRTMEEVLSVIERAGAVEYVPWWKRGPRYP